MTERDYPDWVEKYCDKHGYDPPNAEWNDKKQQWEWSHRVETAPGNFTEFTQDVTLALSPGLRVTSSIERLVIEAELVAEGADLDNPAIPGQNTREDAISRIESKDLEPAWEVCERVQWPPLPEVTE